MEPHEHDIFSRLEREISHDLSQWRRSIVASFETCCLTAYDIEESKSNEPLNLTDPSIRQAIRSRTIDFLMTDWMEFDDTPRKGDFVSLSGESFWHTLDDTNGDLKVFKLPANHKIHGNMMSWDILPYLDEAGLDEDAHKHPDLTSRYVRPFGIHLVLDSPTITDQQGVPAFIAPDRIYLPIHYERANLKLYRAR